MSNSSFNTVAEFETAFSGKANTADIQDNLTSTSATKPLSANQGKVLKTLADTKANSTDMTTALALKSNISDIVNDLTHTDTNKPLSANMATNLYSYLKTGWAPVTATLTYSSADSPTFVATTSADLTGSISVGMRLKLTQTTVKYFIITAITSTTITLYGGTDYTLANATISNVYFSNVKAPLGFPPNQDKWTVKTIISTDIQQASPVAGTWYNLGATTFVLPIGAWAIKNKYFVSSYRISAGSISQLVTLSTSNNGETNKELSTFTATDNILNMQIASSCFTNVNATTKTTYYLNSMAKDSGLGSLRMLHNTFGTQSVISAVCAYL